MTKSAAGERGRQARDAARVRILVADDHEIMRRGIRAILEAQGRWTVCGEAASAADAVRLATELQPDLVVLDLEMPGANGLATVRKITTTAHVPILILASDYSIQLAREAGRAGAHGYFVKSRTGRQLVIAVEAILGRRGLAAATPRDDPRESSGISALTPREREVLALLVAGKSNKEVGLALKISAKTVETHRGRVMAKLRVHSISELLRLAIRAGVADRS